MKRNVFNFMAMFFVAVLTLGFTSCGDDDDDNGTNGGSDPEGTITINMRNRNNGNTEIYLDDSSFYMKIDAADNLCVIKNNYYYETEIACVGKVKGLGSINSIPESGWSSKSLVQPGYGYVVRNHSYDGEIYTVYTRVYVVDYMKTTDGGIIGATVKYQSPWEP